MDQHGATLCSWCTHCDQSNRVFSRFIPPVRFGCLLSPHLAQVARGPPLGVRLIQVRECGAVSESPSPPFPEGGHVGAPWGVLWGAGGGGGVEAHWRGRIGTGPTRVGCGETRALLTGRAGGPKGGPGGGGGKGEGADWFNRWGENEHPCRGYVGAHDFPEGGPGGEGGIHHS